MSDRVSDDDLNQLAEWCSVWEMHGQDGDGGYWSDMVKVTAELQSRRDAEQAALPAVEEMARKIRNAVLAVYSPIGTFELRVDAAITDAITPLYAKLAEYAEVLGKCRVVVDKHRGFIDLHPIVVKKLEGLLARIDALLDTKGGEDALLD